MGNEESQNRNIDIDEENVEVSDCWSLHNAKYVDDLTWTNSAFISLSHKTEAEPTRLKRLAKNLMVHRHPSIVKYVSSWQKNNKFHLVTERVQPLTQVVGNQSTLQICIGLHSLLSAIVFLHEKALSSHNNICCASIYVTPEGIWKLGGLEHLMRFSEMTPGLLLESRNFRYDKAVPPEEDSFNSTSKINTEAIDSYAFGVLVDELLKRKSNDDIPFILEFQEYCKKHLRNSVPSNRANLSDVFHHPVFNHDFIKIYKFLCDLPLKTSVEKENFFRELTEQLFELPEQVIASQLTSLLLSRVVLLDSTAQKYLLPVVLQPKLDDKQDRIALFSEGVFKHFVIPKLLKIFCVRDVQIRIILLNNFHLFCHVFTTEQLRNQVLPELLVGIKDVNDDLVSLTLKALSQLVLLLGATTVIGGKRAKLFTDGRPKSGVVEPIKVTKETKNKNNQSLAKPRTAAPFRDNGLPERPSPDGGEDKSSSLSVEETDCDTEHWSDWELSTEKKAPEISSVSVLDVSVERPPELPKNEEPINDVSEITFLDVKTIPKEEARGKEIDFFHDMEPVISKTQILNVNPSKTKFDVESAGPETNWEGWGGDWELDEETL
ncbi:hypothetical protein RUM44_012813 [Polyplax serrata]|uniref:Protein kinase domain-containing protein n=1 Tax=Polyplax serrata TaxID=468196 RepID=A0ABR1BCE8_POLSC